MSSSQSENRHGHHHHRHRHRGNGGGHHVHHQQQPSSFGESKLLGLFLTKDFKAPFALMMPLSKKTSKGQKTVGGSETVESFVIKT